MCDTTVCNSMEVQCEQPLALWSLISAGILFLNVLLLIFDDCFRLGIVGYGCGTDAEKDSNGKAKSESCWKAFTIVQTFFAVCLFGAFGYGAYAVLSIYPKQRAEAAEPKACEPRLFDPIFFIVLLFDLIVVVTIVLLSCVLCLERCNTMKGSKKSDDTKGLLAGATATAGPLKSAQDTEAAVGTRTDSAASKDE